MRISLKAIRAVTAGALIALLSLYTVTNADEAPEPHTVIEMTVDDLLTQFTTSREEFQDDTDKLYALVEEVAVPLFDFERITRLVLAKHWRTANESQRTAFAEEFKRLLINTYATALFKYTGKEKIEFTNSNIRERKGRKFAKVHSEITIGDGAPIPVDYELILSKQNEWKIYNLIVGGLNMVINYRNTYGASIGKSGLDSVLEAMKKNAAAAKGN